ncbi:hypothetical protein BLL40_03465 [Domibacillus mangrovi]|uniref:Uncharacterized protein n=1 Tax=Domibacillus mangrovi TaxID=1714354 RepID=A0A1Q5P6D4_9BACI|nr:hypothetical protein BLL40_03465 [Domibacillus mangrovi]
MIKKQSIFVDETEKIYADRVSLLSLKDTYIAQAVVTCKLPDLSFLIKYNDAFSPSKDELKKNMASMQ